MNFLNDPKKAKKVFIITLVFMILFLIGSGVLGYFYYQKDNQYKNLLAQNRELKKQQDSNKEELQKQIEDLEEEKETLTREKEILTSEKTGLEKQITDTNAKLATIKTYNEFFKYMNQVIETHNGFDGWTDAEYQIAKTKAQATGNQNFVSTVDWAWNNPSVDPVARLLGVWKSIVSGIEGAL